MNRYEDVRRRIEEARVAARADLEKEEAKADRELEAAERQRQLEQERPIKFERYKPKILALLKSVNEQVLKGEGEVYGWRLIEGKIWPVPVVLGDTDVLRMELHQDEYLESGIVVPDQVGKIEVSWWVGKRKKGDWEKQWQEFERVDPPSGEVAVGCWRRDQTYYLKVKGYEPTFADLDADESEFFARLEELVLNAMVKAYSQ